MTFWSGAVTEQVTVVYHTRHSALPLSQGSNLASALHWTSNEATLNAPVLLTRVLPPGQSIDPHAI